MNSLVRSSQAQTDAAKVERAIARPVQRMEVAVALAQAGMDAASSVYTYAEYKVAGALYEAAQYRQQAAECGYLTPPQVQLYQNLCTEYLQQMNVITTNAGVRIIDEVVNAPLEPKGGLSRLLGGSW